MIRFNGVVYAEGYNAGVAAADARVNGASASYSQGVKDADARANANSENYKAGYNAGKAASSHSVQVTVQYYTASGGQVVRLFLTVDGVQKTFPANIQASGGVYEGMTEWQLDCSNAAYHNQMFTPVNITF